MTSCQESSESVVTRKSQIHLLEPVVDDKNLSILLWKQGSNKVGWSHYLNFT